MLKLLNRGFVSSSSRCLADASDFSKMKSPILASAHVAPSAAPSGGPSAAPMGRDLATPNLTFVRGFHLTDRVDKITAGRYFPSKKKGVKTKLTYEMSQEPQYIGVTKGWNSIHAGNMFVQERPMDKCNIAIEDMFIRKFMAGTWHNLFASEVIIKRKANVITLSGLITRQLQPKKIYFLQGYTEEMLSRLLKCPVKIDIQTVFDKFDLTFKEI